VSASTKYIRNPDTLFLTLLPLQSIWKTSNNSRVTAHIPSPESSHLPVLRIAMPLTKKEAWQQWDAAWDLDKSATQRQAALETALAPTFYYSNPQLEHTITDTGESASLVKFAGVIEQLLQGAGNDITVKHLNWYEHHESAALKWDMVDVKTGEVKIHGWSYGRFDGEGRLLSVVDFW